MLAAPTPTRARAPASALELLLFLERTENAVRKSSGPGGFHGGCSSTVETAEASDAEAEEDIWRAKLCAYERTLRERLEAVQATACWDEAATDRLRGRIEELRPALEQALEKRRAERGPPPEASRAKAPIAKIALRAKVAPDTDREEIMQAGEPATETSHGGAGDEPKRCIENAAPENAARSRLLPPREPGSHAPGRSQAAMAQLETEMLEGSEGLKEISRITLKSLKTDNQRLDDVSAEQQKHLDKLKMEHEKGKQLMKSGQLSFFCTIGMLIVSVVIFFMMIPFIILT